MPVELKLDAEIRTDLGKGASRRLRRAKKVPAVVYGGHKEPVALQLSASQLQRLQEIEAFYSQILDITLEGKTYQAQVKDLQRHPVKGHILHVDLMRVVAGEKMQSKVPVQLIGEDEVVKATGGVLLRDITEVAIECLPKDLPTHIEVDVSGLQLGESIHLADLKLPEGVTIPALELGPDHNVPVVSLAAPRVSAEEAGEAEGEGESEESAE